jgi:magnesium-transporting ATPase (P-type)
MFVADLTIFLVFKSHFPATLQTSWFMTSTISEVIFIFLFRTHLPFFKANRPSRLLLGLSLFVVMTAIILPFTTFGQKIFLFSAPKLEHAPWLVGVIVFNLILAEGVKLLYYSIKKKYQKNV